MGAPGDINISCQTRRPRTHSPRDSSNSRTVSSSWTARPVSLTVCETRATHGLGIGEGVIRQICVGGRVVRRRRCCTLDHRARNSPEKQRPAEKARQPRRCVACGGREGDHGFCLDREVSLIKNSTNDSSPTPRAGETTEESKRKNTTRPASRSTILFASPPHDGPV